MLLYFIFGFLYIFSGSAENVTNNSSTNSTQNVLNNLFTHEHWSDNVDWLLFKEVSSSSSYRNVLISPVSLKLVLALLYEGSGGDTEREIRNVLEFSPKKNETREKFANILKVLQSNVNDDVVLNIGSRIFLDSKISPQQKYAAYASHNYKTEIEPTNFTEPYEASHAINSWASNLTNGRIPELVNPGDLHEVVMLIGNAIYFKGIWTHQFPKNNTEDGGFYVSPNAMVNVPYMTMTNKFFYFESSDLDAKILRLPYKGNRFSLFIMLPNSKEGLSSLINKITLSKLTDLVYMMDETTVKVSLPKFKFNFQAKYAKLLQELGLGLMFQETASFPGIARTQADMYVRLVVSDIVQKSGIEVNEEGSIAYAATDIQLGNKFGDAENTFNATHPFMFFIGEEASGNLLFLGKVANPLEADAIPLPSRFKEDEPSSELPPSVVQAQPLANVPNLQPDNPEKTAVLRRFNYFDLELLKEFSDTGGNIFISPASIKTTLALILEGAKGKCAEEIGNALRIDNIDSKEIREILNRLLFDLNDKMPNTLLETASSVFVSDRFKIIPNYQKKLSEYYKATVRNVDFFDASEAAKIINSWANNATHGIIKEVVGPQNLFADTTIVLANALFFKGKWKSAFDPKSTKLKCFHPPNDRCISTPFMLVSDTFNYNLVVDLSAHAIELPYQDDSYAMLILLPTSGNNIKVLARDMQHASFSAILDQLKPSDVILELPKFELEYTADLVSYLQPLKIQEIFGEKANLTGIIPNENIRINTIVHKAKVEVNEQGTRAAAVTGAVVIPLMGSTSLRLLVDHPFIFFIYHRESRNIVFEGILMEPVDYSGAHVSTPVRPTASPLRTAENRYYPRQGASYQQYQDPDY